MSPGLELARQLQEPTSDTVATADGGEGADVSIHDPQVTDSTLNLETFEGAISDADAAVLITDHDEFEDIEPSTLIHSMGEPIMIDTKGMLEVDEWSNSGVNLIRL